MRSAVAYIRRSKVEAASPGDISRATQLAAIEARASIAGDDTLVTLEDWGRSGRRAKRHLRAEYQRLLDMVAADEVSTIYAYNWSRLGRSSRDILDLADLCKEHGTGIVTATGAQVDPNTADGLMLLTILSAVDTWQAEVQSERTAGGLAAWREANPDKRLGRLPYGEDPNRSDEDLSAVMRAFDDAGSFLGAAKRLNASGVPTRLGGPWATTTVGRVVRRERPRLARTAKKGQPATARHIFTGLLKCQCGATLTSQNSVSGPRYLCHVAHNDPRHPRPYQVSERKLERWAHTVLDPMMNLDLFATLGGDAARDRLADLDAKRDLIIDAYTDGVVTRPERDRRLSVVVADRAKVEASLAGDWRPMMTPSVDWSADPAAINRAIRSLWQFVTLNGGMHPRRVTWWPTVEWGEEGPDVAV